MSGAGTLHGWSDASLYVQKKRSTTILTPEHKDVPDLPPIRIAVTEIPDASGNPTAISITKVGPVTTPQQEMLQELLAALPRSGGKTVEQLATEINRHVNTVRTHLKTLRKQKRAVTKGQLGHAPLWIRATKQRVS